MKRGKQRHFPLFLAGACTVLLLAGCGEKASVHTGADTQTKEAAETEQHAVPEVAEQKAKEAEAAEGKSAKEALQQSGPWNKESREQLEIEEETRRELTEELLEEENMDTSVMEDGRSTTGCSFDIPEGFLCK